MSSTISLPVPTAFEAFPTWQSSLAMHKVIVSICPNPIYVICVSLEGSLRAFYEYASACKDYLSFRFRDKYSSMLTAATTGRTIVPTKDPSIICTCVATIQVMEIYTKSFERKKFAMASPVNLNIPQAAVPVASVPLFTWLATIRCEFYFMCDA